MKNQMKRSTEMLHGILTLYCMLRCKQHALSLAHDAAKLIFKGSMQNRVYKQLLLVKRFPSKSLVWLVNGIQYLPISISIYKPREA